MNDEGRTPEDRPAAAAPATAAASGVVSAAVGLAAGVAGLVVAVVLGGVYFGVLYVGFVAATNLINRAPNPALPLILGLVVGVVGLFGSVALFCHAQLWVIGTLNRRGLRNPHPAATCFLSVFAVVTTVVVAVWVMTENLPRELRGLDVAARGLATLLGVVVVALTPKFITDAREWLTIRLGHGWDG